jgi:DHA3 family macrolide efflux protein-like MFS transporter
MVAMLPGVFLGPFAGALVDRWSRRLVMVIADGGVALTTVALVLLFASGRIEIWHIYVALFLRSLGGAFQWPAMQASVTLMVPEKHLSRVAGANQALQGLLRIAAPPLGALLLMVLPMFAVLMIDIVTAALAILPLLFVAIPQPTRADADNTVTPRQVLRDVRDGLRYMVSWPGLLAIMLLACMINFFLSPTSAFMPLLVTEHFKGGALQLGWLESTQGIGLLVGGLLLSVWGGFKRRIVTSLVGVVGVGVSILIIGLAPANYYWLALACMAICGVMLSLADGPIFAIIQSTTSPEIQGRILSLITSLASAMAPIGMAISAPVGEFMGVRAWFMLAGVLTTLIAVGGMLIPSVLKIEEQAKERALKENLVPQPVAQ